MRKLRTAFAVIALALAVCAPAVRADSSTSRLGLTKPSVGSTGWGVKLNADLDLIDLLVGVYASSGSWTVGQTFSSATVTGTTTLSSTTATGQLIGKGTITNDDPAAGYIGEEKILTRPRADFNYITGTAISVATITLTAGDWDVSGACAYDPSGTTVVTNIFCSINTTANALASSTPFGYPLNQTMTMGFGFPTGNVPSNTLFVAVTPLRVKVATSTLYYVVGSAAFTTSTLTGSGHIRARRIR